MAKSRSPNKKTAKSLAHITNNSQSVPVSEQPRILHNGGEEQELIFWQNRFNECQKILTESPDSYSTWRRGDPAPFIPKRSSPSVPRRGRKNRLKVYDNDPYAFADDMYDPTSTDYNKWPPKGTRLTDFGLYLAVRSLPKSFRRSHYPADFDSDGHIRPSRVPTGPTVGIEAHGKTWFAVYGGYYVLCGGDYALLNSWLIRPFQEFKETSRLYPHDRFHIGLVTGDVQLHSVQMADGSTTSNIRTMEYSNRANDDISQLSGTWLDIRSSQLDIINLYDKDRYIQFPPLPANRGSDVPRLHKFDTKVLTRKTNCKTTLKYPATRISKRAKGFKASRYVGPIHALGEDSEDEDGADSKPAAPSQLAHQMNDPNTEIGPPKPTQSVQDTNLEPPVLEPNRETTASNSNPEASSAISSNIETTVYNPTLSTSEVPIDLESEQSWNPSWGDVPDVVLDDTPGSYTKDKDVNSRNSTDLHHSEHNESDAKLIEGELGNRDSEEPNRYSDALSQTSQILRRARENESIHNPKVAFAADRETNETLSTERPQSTSELNIESARYENSIAEPSVADLEVGIQEPATSAVHTTNHHLNADSSAFRSVGVQTDRGLLDGALLIRVARTLKRSLQSDSEGVASLKRFRREIGGL